VNSLIRWLEDYYPPPVIESNVQQVIEKMGVQHISDELHKKFSEFIQEVRHKVDFKTVSTPLLKRFDSNVRWFESVVVKKARSSKL